MPLTVGTRLGPYEIQSAIGAGGMGEVYRARDTRLKREVAIKVLPEAFSQDPDRLARFQREAELLATLNHPNIAAVYGLEKSDEVTGIVLELVEGETLADLIPRGPLTVSDALPIARQIADALEAAHEKGVVHRDLKPANIKITLDGKVKVLDFGLAKMLETEASPSSLSMSPTLSVHATYPGVILGTAAYMSPEQARGKSVDRRTDVWAFGCVLFEMLTGRRCFEHGDSISDAIARILTQDPDWNRLPPDTPPPIVRLLHRCLKKNASDRLHHLADARIEIDEALASPSSPPIGHASSVRARIISAIPWTITAAAVIVAIGLAAQLRTRATPPVARPLAQLEMNLPPDVEIFQGSSQELALSPDGTRVAFVGNLGGVRHVYVRDLSRLDSVAIRGTENAVSSFFSPTGDAVGFTTTDRGLNTVSLRDNLVTSLAPDAGFVAGGAWGADDRVTFGRDSGLWQMPASGGSPTQLTKLTAGESVHAWPTVLDNGKIILFTSIPTEGLQRSRIEAVSVQTGQRHVIVEGGRFPIYASSGHLVFYRGGGLYATAFDPARVAVIGQPIEVIDSIELDSSGAPLAAVSNAGALVYQRSGVGSGRLVWVSREGTEQAVADATRAYLGPHLAADSRRIVVGVGGDLWIHDTSRSTFTRLTSQQAESASFPVWTPDGKHVIFKTPTGLRSIDTDGSGRSRAIAGTTAGDFPSSVSPDGGTLAVARFTPESSADVYVLSLVGDAQPRGMVKGPAYEGGPQFSPDGGWMAYVSNESGQFQVYLRPYPGPDSRWQVSTDGGTSPLWNHNGKELFYRNGNKMLAVAISTTPEVTLAAPRLVFERRYSYGSTTTMPNYDVSADGQRFLMVKGESGVAYLNVVLNWFSELTRLGPGANR